MHDVTGGRMYQKILLAYDGSSFSKSALRQAVQIAKLCRAELHLLSIVATTRTMLIAEALSPTDIPELEQRELQQDVDAVAQEIRGQGLTLTCQIRVGEPTNEIVAYAREMGADLIVLGHTGKGAFERLLQGSVGVNLLHDLPCSLLVASGNG